MDNKEISKHGLTTGTAGILNSAYQVGKTKEDLNKYITSQLSEALKNGEITKTEMDSALTFAKSNGIFDAMLRQGKLESFDEDTLPNKQAEAIRVESGLDTQDILDVVERFVGKDFEASPTELNNMLTQLNKKIEKNGKTNLSASDLKIMVSSLGISVTEAEEVAYGKQSEVAGGKNSLTNELESKMDEIGDMAGLEWSTKPMKYPGKLPNGSVTRYGNRGECQLTYDSPNKTQRVYKDEEGNIDIIETTYKDNVETLCFKDENGKITSTLKNEILYDDNNNEIGHTQTTYDTEGNITSLKKEDYQNGVVTLQGLLTLANDKGTRVTEYNENGLPKKEVSRDAEGNITKWEESSYFNKDGEEMVTITQKDAQGNVISKETHGSAIEPESKFIK